nr:maleylacetoacetate isomerase [Candidatus Viadribacter manganicus]
MRMLLHGYFRSSAAYRCRIALNLKGVSYEPSFVHLRRGEQRSPAYLVHNPQGLVPALETESGDLTQSLAIIEWLDETFANPPLLPRDAHLRARVRGFAQVIAADIHPLNNLRVLNFLREELQCDETGLDKWRKRWILEGFDACAALLQLDPEGPFCFGDAPSLADICLVPQVYSAQRFGVDMSAWPRLQQIFDACEALPAFADAHPHNQPDCDL